MFNAPPTLAGEGCSVAVATRGLEPAKMVLRGVIRFVGVLNRVVGRAKVVVPVGDRGGLPDPCILAPAGAGTSPGAVGVRSEAGTLPTGAGGSAEDDAGAGVTTGFLVGVGYTRKYRDFRLLALRPWYI